MSLSSLIAKNKTKVFFSLFQQEVKWFKMCVMTLSQKLAVPLLREWWKLHLQAILNANSLCMQLDQFGKMEIIMRQNSLQKLSQIVYLLQIRKDVTQLQSLQLAQVIKLTFIYLRHSIQFSCIKYLLSVRSLHGVMAKVLDCYFELSKFQLQSHYYIHF